MSLLSLSRMSALLLAVWLCLSGAVAAAQDEKARARTLFNEGVAQFEAGEHRAALSSFEAAYRLAPHPAVRVNMANCFEQLGRFVEAVFNYERFLEESGEKVSPAQRREVESAIARLSLQIGTLIVSAEPANAELRIDGQVPKRLPSGAVLLPAGRYEISLSAPGYLNAERTVMIAGQAETPVSVTLEREGQAPAVAAAPADNVGEDRLERDGEDAAFEEDTEGSQGSRALLWVAAGTTVSMAAAVAITGGLALSSRQKFDDLVEVSNDPARTPRQRDAARADGEAYADHAKKLALVSDVLLVGSVLAGGATLWLWLTDRKAEKRAALRAGPMVLRQGGGGLVLGGKF